MSKVNDELKRLVVEWFECQKNMVDQQVTIHIQYSGEKQPTKSHQIIICTISNRVLLFFVLAFTFQFIVYVFWC